jgi:ABC-type sugar transport system substrate-binding protein
MTLGAVKAVEADHRGGSVKIASIDGQNEALAILGQNGFMADVVYPIVEPADLVAAAKACTGESMPNSIMLNYPLVTKANVKAYLGTNFG